MYKLFLILLVFYSSSIFAESSIKKARFELGIGVFLFSAPDYLGSSHTQTVLLPFPMVKYRGEKLKIDNNIQLKLLDKSRFLITISGNGTLPSSDQNIERRGMEMLDATIEFGPSIDYLLTNTDHTELWLNVPIRFAYSIGKNTGFIGKVLNPKISWRKPAVQNYNWNLGLTAGLLFADEDYNSYYYEVKPDEAIATRPAYQAQSGYAGLRTEFTFSTRVSAFWLGGFIRYDNLSGSVNQASPLVSRVNNWSTGIALSWVFSEG